MIKLVFSDMEGTLFRKKYMISNGNTAPNYWSVISRKLGRNAYGEEEKTKDKWTKGKYKGYVEWMEETIRIHQKYGLKRAVFEKIVASAEYYTGVEEVFREFRKKGYGTALISRGFKAFADRASVDLKIDHCFAACEYYWKPDGTIAHWNLLPCDYEGKIDFMKLIMKEHGLEPRHCAFIGDGKNDIPLAKVVGVSIAFNAAKELQEVSTFSINQPKGKEDFRAVLKYF